MEGDELEPCKVLVKQIGNEEAAMRRQLHCERCNMLLYYQLSDGRCRSDAQGQLAHAAKT